MTDFPVTVFHNPACGTSRNVVAMIEAAGHRPDVVEYLKAGWSADQLRSLFARAGMTGREALREKEAGADLLAPGASEEAIIAAMVANPALVNRPFVITPKGVALCRPSEAVFGLLDRRPERFVKEDGEVV